MAEAGGGACAQSVAVTRSIIKKYKKPIWHRFIGACKDYALVNAGDRVAVCISGGKDSFLLAKCMQHLQRVSDVPFEVEYLCLPLHIFCTDIFDSVANVSKNPCYLCARMRRGHLYKNAQALGCNKIALGHHFDDVIETTLMSMVWGAELRTMMPKLHSTHYPGMELIRPLYLVREADIIAWQRYHGLSFLRCACRFTEEAEKRGEDNPHGARAKTKALVAAIRAMNPQGDINVFHSLHNVNLNVLPGWTRGGCAHSFLDDYASAPPWEEDEV